MALGLGLGSVFGNNSANVISPAGSLGLNSNSASSSSIGSFFNSAKEHFPKIVSFGNKYSDQNNLTTDAWQDVMDFNSSEAQKSRDWQTMMRDTNVSSIIEQLKKAGINPLMALPNMTSSTPVASTASSSLPTYADNTTGKALSISSLLSFIGTIIKVFGMLAA